MIGLWGELDVGTGASVEFESRGASALGLDALDGTPVEMESIGLRTLSTFWGDPGSPLRWTVPFVLPPWLVAWTETLGRSVDPLVLCARVEGRVIGIAPLMIRDGTVLFLGDPDVCDCFDCVVAPGFESVFLEAALLHLKALGVAELILGPVRADSIVLGALPEVLHRLGLHPDIRRSGESFEVELPEDWESFLGRLTGKQRHEVRRKMRRFQEAGAVNLRCADRPREIAVAMEDFLRLFRLNRPEKAAFMQAPMEGFFRALAERLGDAGLLRLFSLDLERRPVASAFCLDHGGRRYLYNNGYDEHYGRLSVSLLCKILSVQDAIHAGLAIYDFLKGDEVYKERLGGREVALYEVRINLYP